MSRWISAGLALLLYVTAFPALAQKPPINGVAGPTSASELYSVAPDVMFKRYSEKYMDPSPAIVAGALTLDLTTGNIATVQNTATITSFNVSGALASGASSFIMYVVSNGAANTQTWGGLIKWANGSAPIFTATAGKIDMVACTLYSDLTTWLCASLPNF